MLLLYNVFGFVCSILFPLFCTTQIFAMFTAMLDQVTSRDSKCATSGQILVTAFGGSHVNVRLLNAGGLCLCRPKRQYTKRDRARDRAVMAAWAAQRSRQQVSDFAGHCCRIA